MKNNLGRDPEKTIPKRFFGMIRQGSGSNSHPTTVQFLYLYRLMTVYSLVRPPKRASIQTDPGSSLITLKNLLQSHKKPFKEVQEQLEEHLQNLLCNPSLSYGAPTDNKLLDHDYCAPETFKFILHYLGGYIVHHLLPSLGCDECKNILTAKPEDAAPEKTFTFIKSRGDLLYPGYKLCQLMYWAESKVCEQLTNPNMDVYFSIMDNILNQCSVTLVIGCHNAGHKSYLTSRFLHFFVTCRLYFFTRTINQSFISSVESKKH
ncbi:uncharacterized protein [Centruroides vittatus]|uniref:uncharacterized protein n=1 Tax=Centruroides vittatus TaxID=120091 RepID=UPI00350FF6E2